ncbi:MAG: CBS domain-containing protein [Planctomycetota bacterium]
MTVRLRMTTDFVSIHVDNRLLAAQNLMDWKGLRHLPVIDDEGRVVGMLSHRALQAEWSDSKSRNLSGEEVERRLWNRPVREVMRTQVWMVEPETPVEEASRILRDTGVSCLPVVSSGRKLVGVLSSHDLPRGNAQSRDRGRRTGSAAMALSSGGALPA